jgi:AraC-like DNA-binding protein
VHPLIRIAHIGFKEISLDWGFTHRSSPFWRLYYNFAPGAAIDCATGRIQLDPSRIVVIPAMAVFTAIPPKKPVQHLYLHFDILDGDRQLPVAPLAVTRDDSLRSLLGDGRTPAWNPGDPLQACAVAYRTLALAQLPATPDVEEDYSRRYIGENLGKRLSVSRLAAMAGRSTDHFIRRFAQQHGVTPAQFIIRERVALAKQLLASTDLSLDQIAERCGFSSRGHLATAFKHAEGVTPSVFRERQALV